MGLAEKQAWAAFKENYLNEKLAELHSAAGCNIQVTFDEASFPTKETISWIANAFFDRLNPDIKDICSDNLGKEAIRDSIKNIHCKYQPQGGFTMELADGTFTICAKFDGSAGTDWPGYGTYKEFLMSKL